MSSKSFYSQELGKKILYKTPLFLIPLKLKQSKAIGGNDYQSDFTPIYNKFKNNNYIKWRLMYALNNVSPEAPLIWRAIYLKNINQMPIPYTFTDDMHLNSLLYELFTIADIDQDYTIKIHPLLKSYKQTVDMVYQEMQPGGRIIFKFHNCANFISAHFLQIWYEYIDYLTDGTYKYKLLCGTPSKIKQILETAGFHFIKSFIPKETLEQNPLYLAFILVQKGQI